MSKHTPGPWRSADFAVYADDERTSQLVCQLSSGWTLEQDQANGRLIAAAPELLDVAKRALKCLEEYQPNCIENYDLKAAIVKAEGSK